MSKQKFVVAIEAIQDADTSFDAIVQRLVEETARPQGEWRRALVAPGLGRIVLGAPTQPEAASIADRMSAAGLAAHVIDAGEAENAIEAAFEAVWAEPSGDNLLFIGGAGQDLKVSSSSVRVVAVGKQIKAGLQESFVVLGLRDGVGAVIVRFPGADVTKIVRDPQTPQESVDGFVAYLERIAPHAVVERGLERGGAKLAGLDEVGSKDLAHGGVIAAWILRRFPPKPRAAKPPPPKATFQPPPMASVELADDHRARARDLDGALPEELREEAQAPAPKRSFIASEPSPAALAAQKKKRTIAAAIGVVVLAAVAWVVLHTPARSEHLLRLHDPWKSPYGVTFTYAETYDAGIADVPDLGFVVVAEKGGDKQTFRVANHDAKTLRDAFGTKWLITAVDDTNAAAKNSAWITIEARR